MKKLMVVLASFLAMLFALTACGVSTEEFEAAQSSTAALETEKQQLQEDLESVTAQLDTSEAEASKLRDSEQKRQEEEDAEAERKAQAQEKKDKEKAEKTAAKKAEQAKANKAKKVSKRELAQIVKKPDSNIGKNVIIYARVTQFDSATGPCTFRADVSHAYVGKYSYEHNSMFSAGDGLFSCDILDDVLADDIIKVTTTVTGSLSYDTQIGGSTTVPKFEVVKLKRL